LAWVSGCHLHGCCVGVPLSWRVHWAPVLAFCHSSSVTSRSPHFSCPAGPVIPSFLSLLLGWGCCGGGRHCHCRPLPVAVSPPCCCLPYPIIVILALVAVPSLPLCGPLCRPPFCHLLAISSSSYSSSSSSSSVCFQGCDVARGAYLVRGCWVVGCWLLVVGCWSSIHCPPHEQGLAVVACAVSTVTLL